MIIIVSRGERTRKLPAVLDRVRLLPPDMLMWVYAMLSRLFGNFGWHNPLIKIRILFRKRIYRFFLYSSFFFYIFLILFVWILIKLRDPKNLTFWKCEKARLHSSPKRWESCLDGCIYSIWNIYLIKLYI